MPPRLFSESCSSEPKTALSRRDYEIAGGDGIRQCLDLLAGEFDVIQQDERVFFLQVVSDLSIGWFEWKISFVESVKQELQQVCWRLATR